MEGVTRGACTRGGRRGRGVRVRLPAPAVVTRGGGSGRRGRGSRGSRGGRGGRAGVPQGPPRRPGPSSIDELTIVDISDMPTGEGLETPLHPKRMRVWQRFLECGQSATRTPSTMVVDECLASAASAMPPSLAMLVECGQSAPSSPSTMPPSPSTMPPSALAMPPSPAMFVECGQSAPSSPSTMPPSPSTMPPSPLAMPPSPAMFVECGQSTPSSPSTMPPSPLTMPPSPSMFVECGQTTSTPSRSPIVRSLPRPRQILNDDDIIFELHYGSDESSDESEGENEVVAPLIPRAYRSMMETPSDDDDEPAPVPTIINTPATGSTAPAGVDGGSTETYQPNSFFQFDWKTFPNPPIPPESRRETFSGSSGPTIPHVNPYEIFVSIWDRQFMESIALETNRYAQQVAQEMMDKNSLYPNSRINWWYDTTADELYIYFGMIIAMGIVVKSRLEEFWNSTADIFCTPGFGPHMGINRFLLLNKFLHFRNNHEMRASELSFSDAKLFKIMPVLTHLNTKFQNFYNLSQNIALDESLLQWKGWLDINQLVPNKAAVMGIKSYEICESQTGYLWRFEIHANKKSPQQHPEDPLKASTPSIVLRLTQGLENKGHTLWMDNFYNSPSLARRLKASGIDCVGTLRTNRQFVPQALNDLTKKNMTKGQITGLTSGDIDIMVWRDTNRVSMISTYHGNAAKMVHQSTKPILILDYNIMMGGVDKKDQMLAMYPIERKRTRVWYKKLFRKLLNVSVLNSYIIHHHSGPLSHRDFRISLVKSLLSKHTSVAPLIPLPQTSTLDLTHRLAEYPLQNSYRKRRLCKVCKKRVHTFCVGCGKSVCFDPCFSNLHT